ADPSLDPFAGSPTTTLNCGTTTFDSGTRGWKNFCAGSVVPDFAVFPQTNGPDIVVLAFRDLNVAAGSKLVLQGSLPVVLAVYGSASVKGSIDASGSGASAGAGGNNACGASDGTNGTDGGGGGGGGLVTAGANGGHGSGTNGNQGNGGSARAFGSGTSLI